MLKSIRLRLTITYLLLIVTVMVVTGLVLLNMLEQYYLASEEENLERTGRLAADLMAGYMQDGADAVMLSGVAENFSRQINARVVIVNRHMLVVGDSVHLGGLLGTKMDRPEVEGALQGEIGRSTQYSHLSEQWVMQVAVPIAEGGDPLGAVFLSASLNTVYETLGAIFRFLVLSTVVAVLLAGGLSIIFSHHLTKPIKELTQAARRMAEGNLDQNIPATSGDEIGQLAQQFNIMAAKVKEMNQRLTRFVADVSHELRTPLTSIHVCLQSLQNYDMGPEEQKEFLQDINQETQRLIYLVEDLLDLTRRQEVADKRELFSLNEVLNDVLEVVVPRAERKGLSFFTDIADNLPSLNLSPEALKRVLFNLLDNAIKFTPSGGWLKFSAKYSNNEVCIAVQDTGCGIPEEALPHLFERFYRVDKARSREMGGTGLGLAICKEIVELYGGKIAVESREGEGSTFYLTLPLEGRPGA